MGESKASWKLDENRRGHTPGLTYMHRRVWFRINLYPEGNLSLVLKDLAVRINGRERIRPQGLPGRQGHSTYVLGQECAWVFSSLGQRTKPEYQSEELTELKNQI